MFFDVDYPERLAHIHLPPAVLYVRGDTGVLARRSGAIVGSRNANDYAQRVLRTLIPPLVGAGLVVVSGGARGVDGMAHAITSASGGQTVVVLGSGLARPYPAEHRALFDEVLATGGAVVSPFPMMMQAERGNFPARNRIIAGLSEGVIVVQAARKSGALITAQYALEQGRFVGAVPGSIDDPLSEGCHALLKEGAVVIAGVEDVCAEFGLVPTAVDLEPEKKSTVSDVVQEPRSLVHPLLALLDEPQSFDYLFTRAQLSYGDLQEQLFTLQLEGYIDQDPVGRWYRCSMNR
jgi:DNA processing protein